MHDDRIDRIFHLMRHARREAAYGSKAAGEFDLVLNAADRLSIAHGQQRTDALAPLGDEVERYLDAAPILELDFPLRDGPMQRESIEHNPPEHGGVGKDIFHNLTQNLHSRPSDEPLGRGADQHDMGIAGEQNQAVLQGTHDLVEVSFESAEDFLDISNLAAETVDLGIDHAVFVNP